MNEKNWKSITVHSVVCSDHFVQGMSAMFGRGYPICLPYAVKPDRGRSPDDTPVKGNGSVLSEHSRRQVAHLVRLRQAPRGECCYARYAFLNMVKQTTCMLMFIYWLIPVYLTLACKHL